MTQPRFLVDDERTPIIDVSKNAFPDAPPEAWGPVVLVCPHCGHDERDHAGPHEMFDLITEAGTDLPTVSSRHFLCRECHESSPVWVIRRDGTVTTHMRDAETAEPCMPKGFHERPG